MTAPVRPRKPDWIRVRAPVSPGYADTRRLMRRLELNTVCEEAACPNIGECWANGHATVMILGSVCTRKCAFCNVATGRPDLLDPHEPERLAAAVGSLGLRHVVVTSVDRDDLADGGAGHFVRCIERIRESAPKTTIEVLTPDFLRKPGAVEAVARALARRLQPQSGNRAPALPRRAARGPLRTFAAGAPAREGGVAGGVHQVGPDGRARRDRGRDPRRDGRHARPRRRFPHRGPVSPADSPRTAR